MPVFGVEALAGTSPAKASTPGTYLWMMAKLLSRSG